jgi:rubrerythrin
MSARYHLRAGGHTRSARDLAELAELLGAAIAGEEPIELVYSVNGSPLDDDEFRQLFLRLPVGRSTGTQSGPDGRSYRP